MTQPQDKAETGVIKLARTSKKGGLFCNYDRSEDGGVYYP